MTGRIVRFVLSAVVLASPALLRAQEITVPAGTILQCTLTEPNLSSKTVEVEDPILCDSGPVHEFGISVFPRGAYLGGRLAEYRDPGHFWGKGWMQLSFDRILLPGAEIPISTKVISVPKLNVDAQGRIRGRGHARRDAVEWAIPILWPEKILTLPMRGPRPVLKGEARMTLKLMQDLTIPDGAAGLTAYRPQLKPGVFRTDPDRSTPGLNQAAPSVVERAARVSLASVAPRPEPTSAAEEPRQDTESKPATFLILKDGRGRLVTDYWFESGERIRFVSVDGTVGILPIAVLDVGRTVRLNRERGVEFVIHGRDDDTTPKVEHDLPAGGQE